MSIQSGIVLIKRELTELEGNVTICLKRRKRWPEFIKIQAEDIIADSIAACLHSAYSGIEKIFKIIAKEVDHHLPDGQRWHRELLELMNSDIPDIRQAVISKETFNHIEELMLFRHAFRNLYVHSIVPKKIIDLCDLLDQFWPGFQSEINQFIQFLEALRE
ncbi:MAG: hypothetical protein OMM_10866 [Candidatus Magnetoglobus multicellularis str. Araruama]|uniref:HepT-like domain-containing protein n=1 Tax=Candidatus Magnetoglobus multicellularis str. Araruama TaxID=890399 RepID=A0A1V1NZS0_9BACT|nr:MAG: hypothetical protein OMM_10866 [Candidatus Magnetoglobus multicellularis str. Araruama]